MLKIAHIVNPVTVAQESDLFFAQPITFETMRIAREFCPAEIAVSQLTAQYREDRAAIPPGFEASEDLERSILDIAPFKVDRKLPLMKDILDRLYHSGSADYMIYTNVDIALQPFFYDTVAKIIEQGYDAFVIDRRTIPGTYRQTDEIPLMYAQVGEEHPGWDCFVFKRSLYPRFNLGTACIGINWVGRAMIANMACLAERFEVFKNLHATFHIGDERTWDSPRFDDYLAHNKNECKKILLDLEKTYGPFDRDELPGRFWRQLEKPVKQ